MSSDSGVTVPSTVLTKVLEITLTKGKYIIIASAAWLSNATGYRAITTESSITSTVNRSSIVNAVNGTETRNQFSFIIEVISSYTLELKAFHNRGSDLDCYPHLTAIRVA